MNNREFAGFVVVGALLTTSTVSVLCEKADCEEKAHAHYTVPAVRSNIHISDSGATMAGSTGLGVPWNYNPATGRLEIIQKSDIAGIVRD